MTDTHLTTQHRARLAFNICWWRGARANVDDEMVLYGKLSRYLPTFASYGLGECGSQPKVVENQIEALRSILEERSGLMTDTGGSAKNLSPD